MSKEEAKTLFTLLGDVMEDADIGESLTLFEFTEEVPKASANSHIYGTHRFEQRALLGKGGMGAVHEAYDTVLHRPVATKSLHEVVSIHSSLWKRFYREAQITAQLGHPSIVPVYSIEFTEEQQPLMIMKRIRGVTLEDYIEECKECKEQPLPQMYRLEQRLEILIKICDAMHYAHVKGVIHRDLKPENVMVGAFEDVYVMDWGVATPIRGENVVDPYESDVIKDASLDVEDLGIKTINGQVIGTPRYMSPEQAMGKLERVGPNADQYAIGMMLFELVTLQPARTGKKVLELLDKAICGDQRFEFGKMDPRLKAMILKATDPKVEKRYENTRQLAHDLRLFVRDQAVKALPESFAMRVWRRMRNHPIQLAVTVSSLLAIGGAITITSLWSALQAISETSQHERVTAHLLNQIIAQTQVLDKSFADVQSRVQRLAVRLESVHTLSSSLVEAGCMDYHTLREYPSTRKHHQYDDNWINLLYPVCLVADTTDRTRAGEGLWLSSAMTPYVIEEFKGDVPNFDVSFWTQESVHPIQWAYIGFEDGVLLNYPGVNNFGDGYDPRLRPWYIQGKDSAQPTCGDPYPDASGSGYLLPCNQRVRDANGRLLGVVGLDFLVDSILADIEKKMPKRVHKILLLNKDGDILFSSEDKGVKVAALKRGENQVKEKKRFTNTRIVAAVQDGIQQGLQREQNEIYVYARLQFVPWTLIYVWDDSVWDEDV